MTRPGPGRRASPTEPAVPGRTPNHLPGCTPPRTRARLEQLWQEAHTVRELRSISRPPRRAAWRAALGGWLPHLAARLDPSWPGAPLERR